MKNKLLLTLGLTTIVSCSLLPGLTKVAHATQTKDSYPTYASPTYSLSTKRYFVSLGGTTSLDLPLEDANMREQLTILTAAMSVLRKEYEELKGKVKVLEDRTSIQQQSTAINQIVFVHTLPTSASLSEIMERIQKSQAHNPALQQTATFTAQQVTELAPLTGALKDSPTLTTSQSTLPTMTEEPPTITSLPPATFLHSIPTATEQRLLPPATTPQLTIPSPRIQQPTALTPPPQTTVPAMNLRRTTNDGTTHKRRSSLSVHFAPLNLSPFAPPTCPPNPNNLD
ncbi:MAG: hypothetical protein RLZ12_782 [Bacillota bacterium]